MGAHRISAAVNPISQEEQPSIIHHPSDDQPTSRHPGNQDRPGNQSGSHTPYTRLESVIRNPSVVYNHYLETLLPPDLSHGNPQPTAYNPTKGYMDLDELNNLLKKRKRAQTPESEGNGTFDDRNPKRRQCLPPSQTRPYSGEARQYDSLRNRKSADPKTASRHQNLLYRHSLRRAFDHNSPAYHTKPRVSSELRHTQDSDMNEDTIHPPILESEDTSNINTYKRHPQYPSYLSNPPLNKNNAHDSHIVDPLPSYRSSEHSTPPEHPLSLPPVSGVTLSELTARFPNCPEGCLSMFDDEEYQKILAQRRYREKIAEDSLPAGFWRENKLY